MASLRHIPSSYRTKRRRLSPHLQSGRLDHRRHPRPADPLLGEGPPAHRRPVDGDYLLARGDRNDRLGNRTLPVLPDGPVQENPVQLAVEHSVAAADVR